MSSGRKEKAVGISTKVSVGAATTGEGLASVSAEVRSPAVKNVDVSQVEGKLAGLSTNPKKRRRHKMSGAQERKLRRERAQLRASEAAGQAEGNSSQKGPLPKASDPPQGSQSNLREPVAKCGTTSKKRKRFTWTPLERDSGEKGKGTGAATPGGSGMTDTGLQPSTSMVKPVDGKPGPSKADRTLPTRNAPGLKRGRSDEEATPISKRKKEASTPKSFAQVARGNADDAFIKVAVVDSGAPGGKLTEERQVLLQNALDAAFDAAIDASVEGLPVRFAWSGFRGGLFRATCMDRFTVDFLKEQIAGIGKLWDNCNLQVVGKNDIPRLFKVSVTVRGKPRPTADILSCLKKQNGLSTELWEVHHRKEEEDSVFLVFGVDHTSFKWLNDRDGLVPFRLTSLRFRPGCKPPSDQPAGSEADLARPTSEGDPADRREGGQSTSDMDIQSALRTPRRADTPTPLNSEEERAILGDLSSEEDATLTEGTEEDSAMLED